MSDLLDFISVLRQQWYNLILIMGFNSDFITHEECSFTYNKFYTLFMCSNTADFLWYLFFNKKVDIDNNNAFSMLKTILHDPSEINIFHCYL